MTLEDVVRVLVVDDHPITRDGVRAGLERSGRAVVVAEAADAPTACLLADQVPIDVALVDLRLARDSGLDVIHHLRSHWPAVRILVLSQALPREVLTAIRAGAHGWITKAATSIELGEAVTAVLTTSVIPAELAAHLVGELHRQTPPLTGREQDVLRCLAKGYDNREIAEDLGIALRTVNRHLENIRAKFGRHRRSELIRIARDLNG
ncbi:DNA-binding NarL/FixJ family response regulator [Saccharothrix ecbatanensis]|uniref:DNA-binding NarL/FixJ family response regulator n=1 Tax=Saccharothrix ecbatanensis TaxID=1105145 RepID=A0A7W9M0T0_9PSEU|nr:response regulator transcription factor [Saccharothrix ecbatanensis]MBB5803171.1 DNA-binding NarL/FixJ family response regulator [Saccharothrix ecbatanensis]